MTGYAYSRDDDGLDVRFLGFVSHLSRMYCTTAPELPSRYSEGSLSFAFSPGRTGDPGVGGEGRQSLAASPKDLPVGMDRDATSVSVISHLFPSDSETATVILPPPPPPPRPLPRRPT